MERSVKVTAVVVGTNERSWLHACLSSVLASRRDNIDLSVCYVDNASQDGSADHVAANFPDVGIIASQRNLGFTGANNAAMRVALDEGADYVFLVNPDTQTPPDLLTDLVRFMEKWEEYAIVGPMQYEYAGEPEELGEYSEWALMALQDGERNAFYHDMPDHPASVSDQAGRAPRTLETAYVHGAALFARASVLREIGLFDELFHTYYEEVDLCRRARWAGRRVALLLEFGIQHKCAGGAGNGRYRRVHMRRNRYYYLLTDIGWSASETVRLCARWLGRDLRGRSVGGRTTPFVGVTETIAAIGWLIRHLPRIVRRRRHHRTLGADIPER